MMETNNIKTYPIFAISRHRILRDGDGITTLVGFGGCPLKCKYCINPGSSKMLGFRQCASFQIFNEVYGDNLYYLATGGGVTFGGGEPLLHPDCIVDFVKLCNARWKINIETSFNVPMSAVESVLRIVDEFVVDIKDMNSTIYHNYTGCSNERVIDNLKYVASAGYSKKVKIRVPLIPNYNTEEDVLRSIEILNKLGYSNIERLTYTTDVLNTEDRKSRIVGIYGKRVCETLRTVRQAIIDSTNIEYQLLSCEHTRCESGTCPACEKELQDIENLILHNNKESK